MCLTNDAPLMCLMNDTPLMCLMNDIPEVLVTEAEHYFVFRAILWQLCV